MKSSQQIQPSTMSPSTAMETTGVPLRHLRTVADGLGSGRMPTRTNLSSKLRHLRDFLDFIRLHPRVNALIDDLRNDVEENDHRAGK